MFNEEVNVNFESRANAGYCFVEFENGSIADAVLKKLNGLPVPGTNPVRNKLYFQFQLNLSSIFAEIVSHQNV